MRRQNHPSDFELHSPLMADVADRTGVIVDHGATNSGASAGDGGPHPSTGGPTSKADTRSKPSPRMKPASQSSRCAYLCVLLCDVVSYVAAVFWGVCTAWILVVVLAYCLYGTTPLLVLVLVSIVGIAYNIQDKLLYFPDEPESSRSYVSSPGTTGLPHENLYIQTSDGVKVNAVLFKQTEPLLGRVPTVLFFHGNAGNVAHRYFNAHGLYAMTGCNILFLEYRGFGRSEGTPSESGFYRDAQAGLDYLHHRTDIDTRRIVVFGRSLGGAVAIHLAAQACNRGRIAGVMVENTFTSVPDMGAALFHLEFLRWLPLILVKNKYFSINRVKHIRAATLFISGVDDELVPPRMMHALYQGCGTRKKQLIRFQGGMHNETWRCHGYFTVIREFLTQVSYRETKLIQSLPPGAECVQATDQRPGDVQTV